METSSRGAKRRANEIAAAAVEAADSLQQQAAPCYYAIQCTRKSECIEFDDESFVDRYNDEVDDAEDEINDAAKAYDGTWVDGLEEPNCQLPQPRSKKLKIYASKDAANNAAAALYANLLKHHPFDAVAKKKKHMEWAKQAADETDDCSMTEDGRVLWSGTKYYYVDPWESDCKNVVSSKLTVEAVKVELAG